jgi:hypothetical protein
MSDSFLSKIKKKVTTNVSTQSDPTRRRREEEGAHTRKERKEQVSGMTELGEARMIQSAELGRWVGKELG